jgi:sugar lactone lactonase YvrE
VLAAVSIAASPAPAALRDAEAWEVKAALTELIDVVWWEQRLAAAVEGGGILLFDPQDDSFELLDTTRGLSSLRVRALALGDDGRLWVGTEDAGILRIDPAGSVRAITGLQQQIDVRALAAEGDFVYFGGPQGGGSLVSGLAEQSFTADTGLPSNDVRSVAVFDGRAWFGTDRGVGLFDRGLNEIFVVNDGLADLGVRALHAGPDGVVVGTALGLFRLDEADPGAPVWVSFTPALSVPVADLHRRPGQWAVLGPGDTVHTLDDGASQWQEHPSGASDLRSVALTHDGEGAVWIAGARLDPTRIASDSTPLLRRLDGRRSPALRGLFSFHVRGLALDGEGGVWVGGFPVEDGVTHWRPDGTLAVYARRESSADGSAADGWMSGTKNGLVLVESDELWVSTFTSGVTRLRPAPGGDVEEAEYLHLRPDTSPLQSNRVRAVAKDPKGRLWFGSSGESAVGDRNVGIDVLLDPAAPLDPSSWLKITPQNSQLAGPAIWSIDFEGSDVAWITIENFGLQRFDFDGPLGSGDIENSALVSSGAWDLITNLPEPSGTAIDRPRDVAIGTDGRIWLATDGAGLFGFTYTPFLIGNSVVQRYFTSRPRIPFMSDRLRAVELDDRGGVWVAGNLGLQRVREGATTTVDAFTDVPTFLRNDLGARFLSDIVSPIPGTDLLRLVYDQPRGMLYVGSTTGLSRIRLDAEGDASRRGFDVLLRPNPIRGEERFYVDSFDGVADVEIYTLAGVLVHTARGVRRGEMVWDTRNVNNERVVSGLYVVRVMREGDVVLKTLAVER